MSETDKRPGILSAPAQLAAALRNAIEIARMGGVGGDIAKTPNTTAITAPNYRLRRYTQQNPGRRKRPPIVLVPPLMITSEVYDMAPGTSAVAYLLERGLDPWVVDYGSPAEEGGLERTLTDHITAICDSVEHVREVTGSDVHLAGYSQGGIFVYLAAACMRSRGIASVITFGAPVNVHRGVLPGVPDEVAVPALEGLGRLMSYGFGSSSVPAWLSRNTFKLLSPTKEIRNQLEFILRLHDREAMAKREGQRRFFADEGFVAWPGPAFGEFIEQMIMGNRLFTGGFVIEGRTVTMADITSPMLVCLGTKDDIARPSVVRSVVDAAPRAELYEADIDAGHMGLVASSKAMATTWPTVADWCFWREGRGERPAMAVPMDEAIARARQARAARKAKKRDETGSDGDRSAGEVASTSAMGIAVDLGREIAGLLSDVLGDGADRLRAVGASVAQQLPRVARLQGLGPGSRVGIALALAEQAENDPEGTFFLYEGRAYSYADANRRVDAVTRGLLSIGVRVGDHVGVAMGTRPSALALTAAINRLGAVAVLLRPDGDMAAEIRAGDVDHMIADPEFAGRAAEAFGGTVFALGGVGASKRPLPKTVVDLEKVQPDEVVVPAWYEASPGTSEDVAFILFAGSRDHLRANRITNRRWALSAYGTAGATAMSSTDTVYCWTPIHHPTGILVSMSGALAGGARLALAQGFDATTFWDEVRRYGASIVFYSGAVLHQLVDAPVNPVEHHHPVRLFAGSGMPLPIWQRVVERFGPVGVLEFYASTEGNAILANLSGEKAGSVGRPIPGSTDVALAAYDVSTGEFDYDSDGFVRKATRGTSAALLARVSREHGETEGRPLRNVFERGDAWQDTGEIFREDDEGDLWLVSARDELINTKKGMVAPADIESAMGMIPEISLVAAYGLPVGSHELPVAAITLRKGAKLDPEELGLSIRENLPVSARPVAVRIVKALPMTAGFRLLKQPLKREGFVAADLRGGALVLQGKAYVKASAPLLAKLGLVSEPPGKTVAKAKKAKPIKKA
ncbi:MAG: putative long chain acyl-CoA synthase [Hyphomicrobiaceae bacterium]|jgi:putative long chain acyl-CoA synthase